MYRAYLNECNRTNQSFGYPNYGYGYSNYSNQYQGTPSNWKTFCYGGSRKFPFSWDRDRENENKRGKGNKRPGQKDRDSPEAPRPPPRQRTPSPPPAPPLPPREEIAKLLCVKGIDLQVEKNTEKHRTDKFDCTEDGKELVVRRGDSFMMTLKFDRPFNKKKYDCMLVFSIGKKPNAIRGTKVEITVDETGKEKFKPDQWGANLRGKNDHEITVEVYIPANCIIGEWNLRVTTFFVFDNEEKEPKKFEYKHHEDVTILFNPWCKDDIVYMPATKLLDEYILNDSGCVYRGSAWSFFGKPWIFGQFEEGILEAALSLMRKGFKTANNKMLSNPIKVARMVAKMVNSADDNGVLTGNWSGDYEGGTSPTKWAGTPAILKEYTETGLPVNFGQCWVFSCVTTTICRALGIPCRTVTNFASAHDTDKSSTIDKFYFINEEGKREKMPSGDSVWNFHVWNETWMARPDLGGKREFDGWQVIDATPQELSEGVYQCGPCPVNAIKKGLVNVGSDTPFVFSEVNADRITWLEKYGQWKKINKETRSIGLNISTKVPDGKRYSFKGLKSEKERKAYSDSMRLDVTHEYKFPEGSEDERAAVKTAFELAENKRHGAYSNDVVIHPIKFTLRHKDEVFLGEEMEIHLMAENHGDIERPVNVTISVSPATYTGEVGKPFIIKKFDEVSIPEKRGFEWFSLTLRPTDYEDHLLEHGNVNIEAMITVPQCGDQEEFEYVKAHDVRFSVPDLDIEAPERGEKGEAVTFVVSFTNPMSKPLTKCDVSMESTGFRNIKDEAVKDVAGGETFQKEFKLIPRKKGEHTVAFSFDSKEIKNISGSVTIFVSP